MAIGPVQLIVLGFQHPEFHDDWTPKAVSPAAVAGFGNY